MISYKELNQRNRKLGLGNLSPVAVGARFANSNQKEPIYGATISERRIGELNFEDLMHLIEVKSKKRDLFSFKENLKACNLIEALHIPMNTFADKVEDESVFNRSIGIGNPNKVGNFGGGWNAEYSRSLPSLVSKNITSVAPGADYAGFFRGRTNGYSNEGMTFDRAAWNNFDSCFGFEAWVYMPASNLTISSDNANTNTIFGMGGPASGGLQLCIRNRPVSGYMGTQVPSNPRLVLRNNANNQELVSSIEFPLNTWVRVGVSYNSNTSVTTMMINNHVDSVNAVRRWGQTNGSPRFHIGRLDDNENTSAGVNSAWKGYMSDVKIFLPITAALWNPVSSFYNPINTQKVTWDSLSSDKELKSGIVEVNGIGLVFDRKASIQEFLDSLLSIGVFASISTVFPDNLSSSLDSRFIAAVLSGQRSGTIEIRKLKVGDTVVARSGIPYTISNENEISNIFDFLGLTLKREGRKNSQTSGIRTQEVLAAGGGSGIIGIGLLPL